MIKDDDKIMVIDFPQMVSTSHKDAEMYFNRDVHCIQEFFKKRFGFESDSFPTFRDVVRTHNLDVELSASGYIKKSKSEKSIEDKDEIEDFEQVVSRLRRHTIEENEIDSSDENSEENESESENEEELTIENEENESESVSEDELEEISNDNKTYRPYRDNIMKNRNSNNEDIKTYTSVKMKAPYTESDIRDRVKKSLSKTQKHNHRRKVKKGEASYITKQKQENRIIIKESW